MTVTLTKTVTINLDNVLPMLARAVEARGRDFVYNDHYERCVYGKLSSREVVEPACIIGHLIHQEGGNLKEAISFGSVMPLFGYILGNHSYREGRGGSPQEFVRKGLPGLGSSYRRHLSGFDVTPEAALVLSIAQGMQDQEEPKHSWGEAYDAAVLAHDELVLIRDAKALAAKAADEIEERGWGKGMLVNANGCVCALGGTGAAFYGDPELGYGDTIRGDDIIDAMSNIRRNHAYVKLIKEIAAGVDARFPGAQSALYDWNDHVAAYRDNPQAYVVGKLREYAGVTA